MSQRNGDKARFNRERKRKILRRKTIREFRKALEANPARTDIGEAAGKQ